MNALFSNFNFVRVIKITGMVGGVVSGAVLASQGNYEAGIGIALAALGSPGIAARQ